MAQTEEKLLATRLISEAVNFLQVPFEYKGNGRPGICLDDMIKCCMIKVFNNFSSRRTMSDIKLAHAAGYIRQIPHFNSINNYMQKEELAEWLHRLYKVLALPLANIEDCFAIDSTGFSTFIKRHWVQVRFAKSETYYDFKKLHIVIGVQSGIITSATVTDGFTHDTNYYGPLISETAKRYRLKEIYADTGYLSKDNCKIAESVGAVPFIKPSKQTSKKFGHHVKHAYEWQRMINMWFENRQYFLDHYHKRSNVESAFSAMKRKFLPYVRSKSTQAQYNEILCKVCCYNVSVLCTAMFELGVNLRLEEMK